MEDLHVAYGAREVLKGVSLELDEGEIVTVLGANGAGKSTLLQAVCGLAPISSGLVRYAGRTLNRIPPHGIVAMGISLSPEGRRVFPNPYGGGEPEPGCVHSKEAQGRGQPGEDARARTVPHPKERKDQLAGTLSGGSSRCWP
jgi:branched-chain amino acid transport system ATP-binding protein